MVGPGTRLGIDVSGTHINLCLFDAVTGETFTHKSHAQPEAPLAAVRKGLEQLLRSSGIAINQVTELVHSTTLPLELVQAGDGATVGLLVTKGFEQGLHLTQALKSETLKITRPLADLALTRGIDERVSASGNTLVPFDESDAQDRIRELLDAGVEAIAVCLIHAYANPAHEIRLRDIIRSMNKSIPVFLSSQIVAESGEQDRTLATVVNAYIHQRSSHYLRQLIDEINAMQMAIPVSMMQSTGSLIRVEQAMDMPVCMMTGPQAASASGAASIASTAGFTEALALDMGGTAAKISLIRNGSARLSGKTVIMMSSSGDSPAISLGVPSIDVRLAPGSSSVATSPSIGAVRVGPITESATMGSAGEQSTLAPPTVTNAQLVLGRLRAPGMQAQRQAAEDAIARLAQTLGIDRHRAAQGVIDIATEQLAGPLRSAALEKGLDPAQLALLTCGGAGPMFACGLSLLTGCNPVIVPRAAGVVAALGLTQAQHAQQFAQTLNHVLEEDGGTDAIMTVLDELDSHANAWLSHYLPSAPSGTARQSHIQYRAELRYWRASFQISVSVEPHQLTSLAGHAALRAQLGQAHQRRFGVTPEDQPVELVSLRAIASVPTPNAPLQRFSLQGPDASQALIEHDQIYFDGGFTKTAIYARDRLLSGNRISGPAIITEDGTTTVIDPGFIALVDAFLNLVIRLDDVQPIERQ